MESLYLDLKLSGPAQFKTPPSFSKDQAVTVGS